MNQFDFIGGLPQPQSSAAPVIRNTRPSAAEEKARLVLELGRLALKCPASVSSGSVQKTHAWMHHQKQAMALCANARASVPQLTAAIANLRSFL